MALSTRAFPLESIKDPDVRQALRVIFDRLHDLESDVLRTDLNASGKKITNLGDANSPGDALSLGVADERYTRK